MILVVALIVAAVLITITDRFTSGNLSNVKSSVFGEDLLTIFIAKGVKQ